ncbi:MAG: hypothetical protein SCABRO_02456 [Candidatus Scalindua brodae]|uniref:Uncharacterized protein n=1 Tax=Candidatus Scalindua brodae TaxID=237368 RepID=A0A0B0EID5_9BACT|nr:MAG: hypothetical protein SCABRO_02456 [Candidatus Scalindua brodae]
MRISNLTRTIPFKHILIFAGLVVDQYIVKTDKDLKRVKIKASDNKRIGDQIKICQNYSFRNYRGFDIFYY